MALMSELNVVITNDELQNPNINFVLGSTTLIPSYDAFPEASEVVPRTEVMVVVDPVPVRLSGDKVMPLRCAGSHVTAPPPPPAVGGLPAPVVVTEERAGAATRPAPAETSPRDAKRLRSSRRSMDQNCV